MSSAFGDNLADELSLVWTVHQGVMLMLCFRNVLLWHCTGSLLLILGWLLGDTYKSTYFYMTEAPVQFLASGVFQVLTDVYILFQMFVQFPAKRAGALPVRTPTARRTEAV